MDRGDLDDAISTLRRSAALGPSHLESHFNLGLAYERKGRLRDARFEIARAIALDPQPYALNELALIDLQLGDLQQALNILKNPVSRRTAVRTGAEELTHPKVQTES